MNADEQRSIGVKTCIALGAFLLIYGAVMLTLAYGTGDPAWTFRARRGAPDGPCLGFWIELLRLLLVVPLATYALAAGFARPVFVLLSIADRSTWTPGTTVARALLVILAVSYGGYHLHRCLDRSADGFASRNVAYGHANQCYPGAETAGDWTRLDTQYRSARRALTYYSGYAAVFFAVLVPLVLTVPAYAFGSEDIRCAMEASNALRRVVEQSEGSSQSNRIAEVKAQFQDFRQTLTRLTARHVRLMAAIGAAVAFDQYLGALAMSREAQNDVLFAYAVVAGNLAILGVAACFYYDGWQLAHRFVLDAGDSEGLAFKQFGPPAFVSNLLRYNYSAWIIASLLASPVLASPWRTQLSWILGLLG
jgi:hypothetical protein